MSSLTPDQDLKPKGWSWNPLIGVMYGSVPVGIIAVVIGVIVYLASR
jgi:hypothetical protein